MAGSNVKLLTAEKKQTQTKKKNIHYLLIGFPYSTPKNSEELDNKYVKFFRDLKHFKGLFV